MANKKVYTVLLVFVFLLSGIFLGIQNINPLIIHVRGTPVNKDIAVSDVYLGSTIGLCNVSINCNDFTNYALGIWDGHMCGSLYANNLNISSSGVLYTDGYNIYLAGVFDNKGQVYTGNVETFIKPISYGGSGGGARANNGSEGGFGSPTLVNGGMGTTKIHAQNGSSAKMPLLDNSLLQALYSSGFNNYLAGTRGQPYSFLSFTPNFCLRLPGGSGSNGLYLQANSIIVGNISSNGGNGAYNTQYHIYTGGGGAGSIILAYSGSNITAGNVTTLGGKGGYSNKTIYSGGNGGAGNVYNFSYGKTPPISVGTQFHLPVIKPEFIFNGSTMSISFTRLSLDGTTINGNLSLKMTDVSTNNYTFNYFKTEYYNGVLTQKSTGISNYNNSHHTYFNPDF